MEESNKNGAGISGPGGENASEEKPPRVGFIED